MCASGTNVNRVAQNKNLTYFTVGFPHFAHDKQINAWNSLGMHATNWTSTEMFNYQCHRLSRLKNSSHHVTQHVGIQNLITPQAEHNRWHYGIVPQPKSANNSLHYTLKFKELDHFSVVRNGNVQVPCEICRLHVFPGVCNLHKHSTFFFCVQLDPLFYILCVQKTSECVPGRNGAI